MGKEGKQRAHGKHAAKVFWLRLFIPAEFFHGTALHQQQGSQTAQVLGCLQRIDAVK